MVPLVVLLSLALALRLGLVLFHPGLLGVDGGAYIDTVNHFAYGMEWSGFIRPPLAPGWLLYPFMELLGMDIGYKVWASIFSLAPIIPVYLLTRHFLGHRPALCAAAFASLDLSWAETMVTGALPLVGFALIGMVWWALIVTSEKPTRTSQVMLALSIGLIPWVNQTAAGIAVIVLPVFGVTLFLKAKSVKKSLPSPNIWVPVLLGGVIAFTALPWYLAVSPGNFTYPDSPFIFPERITHFVWIQVFIIALPLGLWAALKADSPSIRALGIVLVILGLLSPWLANDETIINIFYRSRYLMALPFYVLITYFLASHIDRIRDRYQQLWAAGIVATLGLLVVGFIYIFQVQTYYSDQISPVSMRVLEEIKAENPSAGIATNTFSMSVWVGALNQVPSPWVFDYRPPDQYAQQYADLRCVLNWIDNCDPCKAAETLNIGYILVETKFPDLNGLRPYREHYLAPEDKWEVTDQAGWLTPVISEEGVRLWRVSPPHSAR